MIDGLLCLLMLIVFRSLKKSCLFYVSDTYVWIHVFTKQPLKAVLRLFDKELEGLQSSVKDFSFSKTAVHLHRSTKDKLLLKYFIKTIIWKNTFNSWWLLLAFLKSYL